MCFRSKTISSSADLSSAPFLLIVFKHMRRFFDSPRSSFILIDCFLWDSSNSEIDLVSDHIRRRKENCCSVRGPDGNNNMSTMSTLSQRPLKGWMDRRPRVSKPPRSQRESEALLLLMVAGEKAGAWKYRGTSRFDGLETREKAARRASHIKTER